MQDFHAGLIAYLLTQTSLTSLISNRIYPINLPEGVTLPAVVYRETGDNSDDALQAAPTLERPIIEFEAQGATYAEVRAIIRAITATLKNYSGAVGTCNIGGVLKGDYAEDFDPDKKIYWASREFEIFETEG